MNEWDQRIREHPVWAEMGTLGPAIDNAINIEGIAPDTVAGLERLRAVLAFCGKRLAAAEPLITIPGPLNEIASSFVAVREEIEKFISDQDFIHIQAGNVAADRALAVVNQVPGAYSPEELGALVSITTEYRKLVNQNLSRVKKTFQEFSTNTQVLSSRLSELAESVQIEQQKFAQVVLTEQQRLTQIVTDYQGQFSAAQEKRSQEYTDALRQGQQGLTTLVTEYQSQFSTGQDTRSKEFTESQGTRQAKFSEIINEYSNKLSEQNSEFSIKRSELIRTFEANLATLNSDYAAKAQNILGGIHENKVRVEKLVGVIGNLGVTSGYLRTANRAQVLVWIWQALTISSLCTLSILAYRTLSLLEDATGHFNWGGFATRVLLLISLGVIAAYSGSQADKLFVEEKRNRKLALELEAIGPFLAPLPIEDQNKFRTTIGDRSFGRDFEIDGKAHSKSPVSAIDILKSKETKEILEALLILAKKV
jgi:hypothetical protein